MADRHGGRHTCAPVPEAAQIRLWLLAHGCTRAVSLACRRGPLLGLCAPCLSMPTVSSALCSSLSVLCSSLPGLPTRRATHCLANIR